jgi:osmotically-inducible protein OsmY
METALAEWDAMSSDTAVIVLDPPHSIEPPHRLESDVRRRLMQDDSVHFSSLVVRRVRDGVCLEGVVEMDDSAADLAALALSIDGVERVENRLVVRRPLPRRK